MPSDSAQLRTLLSELGVLGGTAFQRDLHTRLARVALEQVRREFAEGLGPDDRSWAPTKRGGTPLVFSGRLAASFGSGLEAAGFGLQSSVVYAGVHQEGAVIRAKRDVLRFRVAGNWVSKREVTIPARPILPDGELGPTWSAALERALDEALAEVMR
jgi:phage gpG-like protein